MSQVTCQFENGVVGNGVVIRAAELLMKNYWRITDLYYTLNPGSVKRDLYEYGEDRNDYIMDPVSNVWSQNLPTHQFLDRVKRGTVDVLREHIDILTGIYEFNALDKKIQMLEKKIESRNVRLDILSCAGPTQKTTSGLLPFTNGVLELHSGVLRPIRPDDFVTLTTGYEYPVNVTSSEMREALIVINRFFDSIFATEEEKEHRLRELTRALHGGEFEDAKIIRYGLANHTMAMEWTLIKTTFGCLAEQVHQRFSTLTRSLKYARLHGTRIVNVNVCFPKTALGQRNRSLLANHTDGQLSFTVDSEREFRGLTSDRSIKKHIIQYVHDFSFPVPEKEVSDLFKTVTFRDAFIQLLIQRYMDKKSDCECCVWY